MKKVALIGAGLRGISYTNTMGKSSKEYQVVAVAEPIDDRREYIKRKHNIPDELCFKSWEEMLKLPKLADIAVIATQDRDHVNSSLAAIEKGYNLLLEKPMAALPEDCIRIEQAAKAKGVAVLVCFVLRYTPFFKSIKAIVDSGRLGNIVNINHIECVGNVHQSHSFVRGNWGNSEESSCMLLQKSSHDMDILQWILGKKCKRVHSFGSLSYFKKENTPEGAPEYCIEGCKHADTCPYNAVKIYFDDKENEWFRSASTQKISPIDADVENILRTTQYGKCIFQCNNNVVDHQVVNLEFEDDITVSFNMSAFNQGGRRIRIMGTKGELVGGMRDDFIEVYDFLTKTKEKIKYTETLTSQSLVGGHGGGDLGIISTLTDVIDSNDLVACDLENTVANHLIAFAAEESRLTGKVIDLDEYTEKIKKSL